MTAEFRISSGLAEKMVQHCNEARPNEACGMLAAKAGEIVRVFRMANASRSPVRYSLEPSEQLAVYNLLDEQGWDLGGVFHSHTHTEAYPSPTDVDQAANPLLPTDRWVVVSLRPPAPSIRSYRIDGDAVTEEPIDVLPG